MNSKCLILLVLLIFAVIKLPAQQTAAPVRPQTHGEFVQIIMGLMESRSSIEPEEKEWLEQFFTSGCKCSAIKDEDKAKECGEKLFESLGLPIAEEGLDNMNEEQERKFMLLFPLTNILRRCPEHG